MQQQPDKHHLHKAVVRKIPNFLTEEAFYHGFNVDLPIDFRYFVPGKTKERTDYSVAYFGFEQQKTLEQFIAKFNNFMIQDEKGKSYHLMVHRALFQSLPSLHNKRLNPLANTIHEQDDFKAFADKLTNKAPPLGAGEDPQSEDEQLLPVKNSKGRIAPLVQSIIEKKLNQGDKPRFGRGSQMQMQPKMKDKKKLMPTSQSSMGQYRVKPKSEY